MHHAAPIKTAIRATALLAAAAAARPTSAVAQEAGRAPATADAPRHRALVARALWPADRYLPNRFPLELELSRGLTPGERIGLLVGNTDVSAGAHWTGARVRYRPTAWRLPAGETEVIAYVVSAQGEWSEIGRAALKVLSRIGLERASLLPTLDLSSTGQLDQRAPGGGSGRGAYQDLTLRIGLENTLAHDGWELAAQGNAVGVSEETQRLRWGDRGAEAPVVDLADYHIRAARGATRIELGQVSAGSNRFLVSGFGSRGLVAATRLGPAVAIDAALVGGSSVVGWSNLLGVTRPEHRIATATLGLELMPKRPGGLHLDVSGVDGSVMPEAGYSQGAVTDAEASRGLGLQLSASDRRQRIRFAGGIARPRFVNPGDRLLAGDTSLVSVVPTARTARFGELSLQLLDNLSLGGGTRVSLATGLRHERVDPLYRSVGGSLQSDIQNDGVEITGRIGAVAFQASGSAARDNLARIPSILTSRTGSRGLSVAGPLAALLGARPDAPYLPTVAYSWQRTRQYGEGVPVDGGFAASHVPDQWSTAQSGSLTWTAERWSFSYQWNQSFQDNRQPGRERADFRGIVHAVSLGLAGVRNLTPSLEASIERQKNFESGLVQRTERLGGSLGAQLTRTTALNGSLSQAWGVDPFGGARTRNTELQVELSQGFNVYRPTSGGTQAGVFVRYARARAAFLPDRSESPMAPELRWTLNAGGSVRLY